jgi:hypothetical protein
VGKFFGLDERVKRLAGLLEENTNLDVVDAKLVSISIVNELVFCSGTERFSGKKSCRT